MTRPQPHQPNSDQGQHEPDDDEDDEHDEDDVPRDDQGRQEPQHDDGHGMPEMVYSVEHEYHEDVHGDHLVRVVSPVGVFAEFIGTPGAELIITTPPGHADVPPKGKLPLQAHVKYPDPDHPPQQVTAQADWKSSHREVGSIGNAPGIGNQGIAQAPGSSEPTKGVVTGRKKGTTKITATFGGLIASKTITVKDPGASALTIDTPSGHPEVKQGQKLPLRATVTLDGGKAQAVTNKTRWVSSDPAVATVSPTGEVTGMKGGTAVITGTYQDQEGKQVMAKLKVTVEAELDGKGAHTEKQGEDQNSENGENKGSEDKGSEDSDKGAGSDKNNTPESTEDANKPSANSSEGESTPTQGSQDPSQGSAQQPAQDPNAAQGQPAEGGVQPQYGQ